MAKLTPFALAALALLGACSTTSQQAAAPNINTIVHPMRPGTGVVQAIMPAPMMAAAGGSAASAPSDSMQRLEIRMSNGQVQYVDTRSAGQITKGDRVQLGADGVIRKV